MVDDLEQRLSRYRADLDAAVAADLARRQLVSGQAGFNDADPLLLDLDYPIRLEPTTSTPPARRRTMLQAALAAAAAVATLVLVGVVVSRDADGTTPANQPFPTVTVPPTTPPRALPGNSQLLEQLAPGTYFLGGAVESMTPRILLTVGSGWSSDGGMLFRRSEGGDDEGFIVVDRPVEQYSDACHWTDGYRPGWPTRTLDEVVAALTEQKGWAEMTTPTDISIDGYAGRAFQRTAPTDITNCDTTTERRTRTSPSGLHPEFNLNEPGDIEDFRVLDIDGTVVVVLARQYPETSAAARAEIAAVLDSIRIERP